MRLLEDLARHRQIDPPADRRHWIVHVSQENLLPARRTLIIASAGPSLGDIGALYVATT